MLPLLLTSQNPSVKCSPEEAGASSGVISGMVSEILNFWFFFFQICEAQPEISNSFKTSEFIPLPRLLSMVMVTTVPAVCNKIMFTQGLNVRAVYSISMIFLSQLILFDLSV